MKGRHLHYTPDELAVVEVLSALPRDVIVAELAHVFGRTDLTADNVRQLCIRRGWTTRERWTADEDAQMRELFPHRPTIEVARQIGRSYAATHQRAAKLGLKKTAAFHASAASGRIKKGERRAPGTEFKKGITPANKGVRGRKGWAPGRMKETQFTKGKTPHTWMPVGSTRLIDGYEYTKVTDHRNVPYTVNWKPTHWLRWEAVHGPVPKGHALKCLDGNRLNTEASNWECVARGVLARLNGGRMKKRIAFDAAPAEIKPTVMALAKLEHLASKRRAAA